MNLPFPDIKALLVSEINKVRKEMGELRMEVQKTENTVKELDDKV